MKILSYNIPYEHEKLSPFIIQGILAADNTSTIYCFQNIKQNQLDKIKSFIKKKTNKYYVFYNIYENRKNTGGVLILVNKDMWQNSKIEFDKPNFDKKLGNILNGKILTCIFNNYVLLNINGEFDEKMKNIFYAYLDAYIECLKTTYPESYIIICGNLGTGISDYDYSTNEQIKNFSYTTQKINEIIAKYKLIDIYRNTHKRDKQYINESNIKFCHFLIDNKIANNFLFKNTDISEKTIFNNKYITLELLDIA